LDQDYFLTNPIGKIITLTVGWVDASNREGVRVF